MSKHSNPILIDRTRQEPKHSAGSTRIGSYWDQLLRDEPGSGKHAKPFAKHHPATPVIYNQAGDVVPLFPTANVLDVAA